MTSNEIRRQINTKEKQVSEFKLLQLPRLQAMLEKEIVTLREQLREAEERESEER